MRRLLGLKKSPNTQEETKKNQQQQQTQPFNENANPSSDESTFKSPGQATEGLGLGISLSEESESPNKTQSKHIVFESPQRPSFIKPSQTAPPTSYPRASSTQSRSNQSLDQDTYTGSFVGSERRGGGAKGGADPGTFTIQRTTSPLSLAPSFTSYLNTRDDGAICAPLTWGDMANAELVVNLSSRERTRQEVLWECVASEER